MKWKYSLFPSSSCCCIAEDVDRGIFHISSNLTWGYKTNIAYLPKTKWNCWVKWSKITVSKQGFLLVITIQGHVPRPLESYLLLFQEMCWIQALQGAWEKPVVGHLQWRQPCWTACLNRLRLACTASKLCICLSWSFAFCQAMGP